MLRRDNMPNENMATYDLTLEYYKEYLGIDLEEFCKFWMTVTVE